jgi:hypothetical protein
VCEGWRRRTASLIRVELVKGARVAQYEDAAAVLGPARVQAHDTRDGDALQRGEGRVDAGLAVEAPDRAFLATMRARARKEERRRNPLTSCCGQ